MDSQEILAPVELPVADAGVQPAIEEGLAAPAETVQVPAAAPEPKKPPTDWEERARDFEDRWKREEQRRKSLEGSQLGRRAMEQRLANIETTLTRMESFNRVVAEHFGKEDPTAEGFRQKLSEVEADTTKNLRSSRFDGTNARLWANLSKQARGLGLNLSDAAIYTKHPELNEAALIWNAALRDRNVEDLIEAKAAMDDALMNLGEEQQMEKTDRSRAAQPRRETAPPRVDTGRAMVGGIEAANRDNIDTLYMKWEREHPGKDNPYEKQYWEMLSKH